jgi:RNA polymerase sigma-70 factor (ECF subfamily)
MERFRSVQQPGDDVEERLVERALRGEIQAFNQLVELHQRTLYGVAVRMLGDAHAAADVTQDSILAAWQHLPTFRSGSLRAWLTRIVVNRCYDALRARKRRPERSYDAILAEQPETERFAGEAPDPESLAVTGELARHLNAGLATLPLDQRAVVILCDIQGFAYAEAAEIERTNIGTVRSRLSRGRAKMRDWLAARPELLPGGIRSVYMQEKA